MALGVSPVPSTCATGWLAYVLQRVPRPSNAEAVTRPVPASRRPPPGKSRKIGDVVGTLSSINCDEQEQERKIGNLVGKSRHINALHRNPSTDLRDPPTSPAQVARLGGQ